MSTAAPQEQPQAPTLIQTSGNDRSTQPSNMFIALSSWHFILFAIKIYPFIYIVKNLGSSEPTRWGIFALFLAYIGLAIVAIIFFAAKKTASFDTAYYVLEILFGSVFLGILYAVLVSDRTPLTQDEIKALTVVGYAYIVFFTFITLFIPLYAPHKFMLSYTIEKINKETCHQYVLTNPSAQQQQPPAEPPAAAAPQSS